MDCYYLGQIVLFAGPYAPQDFVLCNGQMLTISQYETLYSVIGTTYGGDGRTVFGVPDLRGRVPIGYGQGVVAPKAGGGGTLTAHALAATGGSQTVSLTAAQIPPHTHGFNTVDAPATSNDPSNAMLAVVPGGTTFYIADQAGGPTPVTVQLGSAAVTSAGGDIGHANLMPTMALNYLIYTKGIYPAFA